MPNRNNLRWDRDHLTPCSEGFSSWLVGPMHLQNITAARRWHRKNFLTSCRREAKEEGLEARDNLQGYLHHTKSALQRGADGSRGKVSGQNELRVLKCYPHTSQARTRTQSENDKGWVGSDGKDWIEQSSGDDDVKRNLRNCWRTFR